MLDCIPCGEEDYYGSEPFSLQVISRHACKYSTALGRDRAFYETTMKIIFFCLEERLTLCMGSWICPKSRLCHSSESKKIVSCYWCPPYMNPKLFFNIIAYHSLKVQIMLITTKMPESRLCSWNGQIIPRFWDGTLLPSCNRDHTTLIQSSPEARTFFWKHCSSFLHWLVEVVESASTTIANSNKEYNGYDHCCWPYLIYRLSTDMANKGLSIKVYYNNF